MACARLDAEVYPDQRVSSFVEQNFVPVKVHIKEQPAAFGRFGVQWTPVALVLDPGGAERHRWEGYLPAEEFLAQLQLGLARSAFAAEKWPDAERRYREVAQQHPKTEAAPEAIYWAGVAKYKAGDASGLREAARALKEKYPESVWAKKSSVWLS